MAEGKERLESYRRDLSASIHTLIRDEPAVVLAEVTGTRERTALAWQRGEHLPSLAAAFALAAEHPEVKHLFLRLLLVGPDSPEGSDLAQARAKFLEANVE